MPVRRVVIYHSTYGCDTGCCGHVIEINDGDGTREVTIDHQFTFDHPERDDDFMEWAMHLVEAIYSKEHVADLDWEDCIVTSE